MGKQKQVKYQLDLQTAKDIVAIIAGHRTRHARITEIMDEITRLKEKSEIFVQGGKNASKQEIAERLYQDARKNYYTLFETTDAVDKALEEIKQNQENKHLGEQLAKAILISCEHFGEHGYGAEKLVRKYKLYMSERTFKYDRRAFVEDVGRRLGYLGTIEFDLCCKKSLPIWQ